MRAMVVAAQAAAAEVGANVLRRGGNGIDAAVATALAQGVIDPTNCGIGGFGSCLLFQAGAGKVEVLTFHGRAGSLVQPGMWSDIVLGEYEGGPGYHLRDFVNDVGYRSITTPGTVAGLSALLREYGTWDWRDCTGPATSFAAQGYQLTPRARELFADLPAEDLPHPAVRATATPASRRIFTRDGHNPRLRGEILVQEDYGRTLEQLAVRGPEDFYSGQTAPLIASDIGSHGGFVTSADLENYQVRRPAPLVGSYRGYSIVTDPPPSAGAVLLEMLNILEGYDLASMEPGGDEHVYLLASAMRWASRDRANLLGDPDFAEVDVGTMLDKAHAELARSAIDRGDLAIVPRWRADEHGTTHICVRDASGNLVSLTHSLGDASGVVTDGLGFQYNNAMNCFNPVPGHPNSIVAGKARVTGICPTIVMEGERPVMVVGASGGSRIPNSVLQALVNVLDFGMSPSEALCVPRFDCQGERLEVEARMPVSTRDSLQRRGHTVVKPVASWWTWPLVHLFVLDPVSGSLKGAADPRSEGMALAVG